MYNSPFEPNNDKNGHYSDLRAEKLVYKLSCLVPGGRIRFQKMWGCHALFDEFCTFRKVQNSSKKV